MYLLLDSQTKLSTKVRECYFVVNDTFSDLAKIIVVGKNQSETLNGYCRAMSSVWNVSGPISDEWGKIKHAKSYVFLDSVFQL